MASNNILSFSSINALGKIAGNFADTAIASTSNSQGTPSAGITATGTYTISDIVFTADASMMNEQGYLECPSKNYTSYVDAFTGSSRFNCNFVT